MPVIKEHIQSLRLDAFYEYLNTLDASEALDVLQIIETDITMINIQLESAKESHFTEPGRDAAWYSKAKSALHIKGRMHQATQRRMGKLKREAQANRPVDANDKWRQMFFQEAKKALEPDEMARLIEQTDQRMAEEVFNGTSR